MTIIPIDALQPETLQALVEEFVTRHGAIHGQGEADVTAHIQQVLGQLKSGRAVVVFDASTESCTIAARQDLPAVPPHDEPRHIEPAGDWE